MNRATALPAALACGVCALFATQVVRWRSLQQDLATARSSLVHLRADAAELERLRAAEATRLFGAPPDEDVNARVAGCLATIALPESTAVSIKREGDRAIGNAPRDQGRRRRDVRVELRPISPAKLGEYLAAWNEHNPAWTVSATSLRKLTDRRSGPDDYHVTLTCSAEYTGEGNTP